MRRCSAFLAVALLAAPAALFAQEDVARAVAGGGVLVTGWKGVADGGAAITDAKFASMGPGIHITSGPAATYWNPANTASGDYTVKATFSEPKFMNLNTHPHPYGIMIGGNDMDTPNATYFYCAVNGNGTFITRGFGPKPFQMNGMRGGANEAVHKAPGKDQPVSNEVAVSVKGDKVSCSINGVEVASYSKAELVTDGKLKSTDGVYGIRTAHNTETHVANFGMTKN